MQLIKARSGTGHVRDWLASSQNPRILHVFERACNLINEHSDVLSIVTPEIGNGPFNLVIPDPSSSSPPSEVFSSVNIESPVSILGDELSLGDLTINTTNAQLWNPRPNWKKLHTGRVDITKLVSSGYRECGLDMPFAANAQGYSTTFDNPELPITDYQSTNSLISPLSSSLANNDVSNARDIASQLAGLGPGLTPSGDDILLGAIYAAWIIHPPEIAHTLTEAIANTAAPLTTSLSAAWLKAGARGEAGELWHELFNALLAADSSAIQQRITKMLSVGHTSGADALVGFVSTMLAHMAQSNL